ncbi:hypothetical protein Areg01_85570 [Actinoplanes regularis]|nr:hypothetical protein Areg01_85570 [Actinoplanes regularis]
MFRDIFNRRAMAWIAIPSDRRSRRISAQSSTLSTSRCFRRWSRFTRNHVVSFQAEPTPRTFKFCKTNGGTSTNGPNGYSRCFIPGGENSNGGDWLGRFYSRADGGRRILDNDQFYVKVS